jgi:acyl-CoA thioester hydrolase
VTFTHRHRVRYHEVDLQSFLFNGRYLEIADVAMSEFFRDLGWSYPDLIAAGMDPSVVSAAIQFAAPARLDDLVDVQVRCPRVGASSFDLHMQVFRDDAPLASIELVYVNVDPEAARARPIPPAVAAALGR